MKTNILLLLLTICSTIYLQAQRNTAAPGAYEQPLYIIKTNPLPMLGGQIPFTNEYRLVFEARTGPRTSAQLSASYIGRSPFLSLIERFSSNNLDDSIRIGVSGFRLQGTYKFFVLKKQEAPEGFYVGPSLSFATAKLWNKNATNDYVNAYYTSLSGVIGYQIIAGKHFAFDAFAGLGIKYNKYAFNTNQQNSNIEFNRLQWFGPKFMLGFNLGYAW